MLVNRLPSLLKRNSIFRNFLSATTVSFLGSNIFDIAMPLYVWGLTHSPIALSMVTVGLHLPYFLMAPFTGYTVDNFDKRRVMLLSDIGQVVCMLFLLGYDIAGATTVWPIVLAVFVAKTFTITFETVTTFQLVPALVAPEDLSQANTWFLSSLRLIQVVGPLTGGILMSVLGVRSCILVNVMSFGATLYFVYRTRHLNQLIDGEAERPAGGRLSFQRFSSNFTESIRYVWKSEIFRPFIAVMFLWNLSPLIPNTPSITYYFTAQMGFSAAEYGLVVSMIGVFGIVGYVMASFAYDKLDFTRAFVGSSLWQALLGTLSLVFIGQPAALALIFAFSRMGSSVLNMGTFLIRQTRIPKAKMGGINASLRMFFMSAGPLSAIFQGYLILHFGVGASLVLGAACLWGVFWYAKSVAGLYDRQPKPAVDRAA